MNKRDKQPLLWVAVAALAIVALLMFIQGRLDELAEDKRNEEDAKQMPRIFREDAYLKELQKRLDRVNEGKSNPPPESPEVIIQRYRNEQTNPNSP